jgi:hypothetical protein
MNVHIKTPLPAPSSEPVSRQEQQRRQREIILAALRTVCKRLDQIREEVAFHGVALANDAIDPQTAIRLTEEVAPGCLPPELNAICIANGWEILS